MPAVTTFKLLGVAGIASYSLARAAVHFRLLSWHRAFVVAVPRHRLPAMPRGFAVREIGFDELARWEVDVTPAQQAERFAQGIVCLGAFNSGGELTGVVWMSAGGCMEGDLSLLSRPPANAAWDTGMWIHPDHRLGRSFQALWAGVAKWLAVRELDWSISGIADYNINSMRSHERLGMVRIGQIIALRIGGWQWIAAGAMQWRMVRPGQRIEWQVPPIEPDVTPRQLTPSIAG